MMARTCFLVGVLHAASAATVGPHLFKDAEGPKVLRGLFPSEAAPEKIIEPFVGESYPLVRVHRDGDKKSGDDATAEALVSELKDKLPGDAFGTLARAAAPVSVVLQFEHLARDAWPEEIVDLAGPFGPTNPRADSEGGLLVHAYASSPGAAALAEHADTGDVLVVQLAGSKTFAFDGEAVTLAPGDGLVLPSGTRHAARAADDEASLHVTLHNFVPHEHLVTRSRRRLLEYADDDDEYADDDATSCWDYEGSDKECSCHCNECTSCSDADTVCASSVPEGYNREKYSVCCLSFGYRIEHDEDGNCDGYDELDACAGLAKKTCKKTAGCAYKQKTCSASVGDACSELAKKTCKKTDGCSYKKRACTSCASYASKKDCKKHKKSCKWKKNKCLGKK
mmetsp:Transcript_20529/g.67801  ORF Transcript_20529/g.67801 Transcript_20529/m.67801 type:complete len:395 (-) Transcript_20529:642-1826(-)